MSVWNIVWELLASLIVACLLIYPIRRIFRRAGIDLKFGYLLFVPFAGVFIVTGILALANWPSKVASRETVQAPE